MGAARWSRLGLVCCGAVRVGIAIIMALRIAFMGTPVFAAGCLSAVVAAGHEVVCVYSQPPSRSGRGQTLRKSAVQERAEALGLDVRTPVSLKSRDEIDAFAALQLDAAVVVAYGQILRQPILDAPRLGCFNVHASLLPRWRGAAPIQRAIMAGDGETGVQVMRMEAGLDTGPVLSTARTAIAAQDTAGSLHDRLADLGAALLVATLTDIERGRALEVAQSGEGVTYADKIDKAEARVDWTRPAEEVDRLIRGLAPFPGAWCEWPGEKRPLRLKLLMSHVGGKRGEGGAGTPVCGVPGAVFVAGDRVWIGCGVGRVELLAVQREGKKPQSGEEFVRSLRAVPETVI